MPINLWPRRMKKIIFGTKFINRSERISTVCFFVGNGITNKNTITCMMISKLRDREAVIHLNTIINDALSDKYDKIWTYYNINEQCILFLNGNIAFELQEKMNTYKLKLNIWNRYSYRIKSTYSDQLHFFGEDDDICQKVYGYFSK
tara:strand:+ start:1188 stop:1625 length:438 start_codon:yes stop_codon:yes gene_type:complete